MRKFLFIMLFLFLPFYVYAEELDEIKSKNAILINMNDNSILYEKNSEEEVLIASMTKIMTAIVAIENINDLDEKLVLPNNIFKDLANDLSVAKFKENETVTYRDLLYGALLPSGADATHALAVFISGNEENFVKLMNAKAKELNLTHTSFSNTVGIETTDNKNYSSVKDVSVILRYALKNKTFKTIFTSSSYKTSDNLLEFKSTKSKVLEKYDIDLSMIIGSKTGFTSRAGLCLSSIASYNNINYLLVTAGAEYETSKINHFIDANKIYSFFYNNYEYKTIVKKNDVVYKIKTKYNEDVNLKLNKDITLYLNKKIKKQDLEYEYKGKKILENNVKKNDYIGKYYIRYKGKILCEEKVYSPLTVRFKLKKYQIKFIFLLLILFSYIILKNKLKKIEK